MRLLDRYLLRELLIPLGYILGGFLIVWDAFSLFMELNQYQERHMGVSDVLELYVVRVPQTLVLILPIVLLLALLYTLTNHARHNELTAIRAAGIGLWRICLPYLGVGFLLSLALFFMNEHWVPGAANREHEIRNRHVKSDDSVPDEVKNYGFKISSEGRYWTFASYNQQTHVMTQPRVLWTPDTHVEQRLTASHAEYINGVWTFFDVTEQAGTNHIVTNVMAMPEFSETPDEINLQLGFESRLARRSADDVPITAILDYLKQHPHDLSTKDRAWLTTQLQGRFAAPWTCLVVVFIAIPFGAASGRRNLFAGVAGSIVICFVYFVLMKLGLALGTGGTVPGWVAAWLPNIAFSLAGFWLMLRVR